MQAMHRPGADRPTRWFTRARKYELRKSRQMGVLSHMREFLSTIPIPVAAAKSGHPALAAERPTIPSVCFRRAASTAVGAGTADVSCKTVTDTPHSPPSGRGQKASAGGKGGAARSTGFDSAAAKPEVNKPRKPGHCSARCLNHPPRAKKKIKKKAETPKRDAKKTDYLRKRDTPQCAAVSRRSQPRQPSRQGERILRVQVTKYGHGQMGDRSAAL